MACPVCGRTWGLRKDGTMRAHHGYDDSARLPGGNCAGSGQFPEDE